MFIQADSHPTQPIDRVVIDTNHIDWQPSPSPTVWRKRLELLGSAESGRVTSIVRYDAGAAFAAHNHPEGEEILVLDGVFSDEWGDYPAGSYLLNPEGFRHAPFSRTGCLLFVKLRQYGGDQRQQIHLNTHQLDWVPLVTGIDIKAGIDIKPLYRQPQYPEHMRLERWQPGTEWTPEAIVREVLVLEGSFSDAWGHYAAGTWIRQTSNRALTSTMGCLLYVKTGWRAE